MTYPLGENLGTQVLHWYLEAAGTVIVDHLDRDQGIRANSRLLGGSRHGSDWSNNNRRSIARELLVTATDIKSSQYHQSSGGRSRWTTPY